LAGIHKADRRRVGKERLGKATGEPARRLFTGCHRRDHGICCVRKRLVIHYSIERFLKFPTGFTRATAYTLFPQMPKIFTARSTFCLSHFHSHRRYICTTWKR
jgi:hypothetical protein